MHRVPRATSAGLPPRSSIDLLAFSLTGLSTAILGATLPAMLHLWRLSDDRGGLLLLMASCGSTAGAFVARRPAPRTAPAALGLTMASLLLLSGSHPRALPLLFLVYGLGLGTAMTAISTLRARSASGETAAAEMNRLNLLWAAGACVAPFLAARSLHVLSISAVFRVLAGAFLLTILGLLLRRNEAASLVTETAAAGTSPLAPLRFCLFAAAVVGQESATGSWLATYAERTSSGVTTAVSATAAFWAGLLLSRAIHSSLRLRWPRTRQARMAHAGTAGLGITLLIAFPGHLLTPLAGLLCGFGLGPLYPYILAVALPRFRATPVFVTAGLGASIVPWLTGFLSSRLGSLRLGLLAPLLAFIVLVINGALIESGGPETAL